MKPLNPDCDSYLPQHVGMQRSYEKNSVVDYSANTVAAFFVRSVGKSSLLLFI